MRDEHTSQETSSEAQEPEEVFSDDNCGVLYTADDLRVKNPRRQYMDEKGIKHSCH